MRNLKKVLSLALALVMLLGMMVVGAGAAYTDQADIANEEAVEVLNALDVIKGFDDGSYKPENTMTRAQAAVVIARMLLGDSVKNLTVVSARYSDVKTDFWAAKEIEFCSQVGIVSGVGNGKYNPNGNVTGAQFAKMLLCALGYDEAKQGYTGDNWANNVANDARKAGLIAGVTISNEAMTRDGMAQLAFNTLTADIVEYTGRDIQIGEIVIPGSNATKIMHAAGDKKYTDTGAGTATVNDPVKFCEQYLPALTVDTADEDELRHAAKTWKVDGDDVYTKVTETPAMTLRGENYKANTLKGYTDSDDIEVYYNGSEITNPESGEWYTAMQGKYGVTIEVYCTGKTIDKVVVVEPFLTVVTGVNAKAKTVTLTVYEAGYYIGHDNTYKTVTIGEAAPDYALVKDMEKGYVFMGVFNSDWDAAGASRQPLVKVLGEPEPITGKVTAKAADGYYTGTVTIDGTKYPFANEYSQSALAVKSEGTFYLYDGSVYHFDADEEDTTPTAFAMVAGSPVATVAKTVDDDTATVEARFVLGDGTVGVYNVKLTKGGVNDGAKNGKTYMDTGKTLELVNPTSPSTIDASALTNGAILGYKLSDDGKEITLTALDSTLEEDAIVALTTTAVMNPGDTSAVASGDKGLLTNKTVYVIYDSDNKTATQSVGAIPAGVTLDVGTKMVVTGTATANTGLTNVVFATATTSVDADLAGYAYVDTSDSEQVLAEDGKTVLTVYTGTTIDGEEIELTIKEGVTVAADAAGVFKYNTSNEICAATPETAYQAVVASNLIVVNNKAYNITDDTQTVIIDPNLEGANGNMCVVIAAGTTGAAANTAAQIFVIEAPAE